MSKEQANAIAEDFLTQVNAQRRLLEEVGIFIATLQDNPEAVRLTGMIRAQLSDHVDLQQTVARLYGDDRP